MKEDTVLFGTFDEIKEMYNNLGFISDDSRVYEDGAKFNKELNPFDDQIKNVVGKIQMLSWFVTTYTKPKEIDELPKLSMSITTKKVCVTHELKKEDLLSAIKDSENGTTAN